MRIWELSIVFHKLEHLNERASYHWFQYFVLCRSKESGTHRTNSILTFIIKSLR